MYEFDDAEDTARRIEVAALELAYQLPSPPEPEYLPPQPPFARRVGGMALKVGRIFADRMSYPRLFALGVVARAIHDDERRFRRYQ